ncbi:MAG TPA: RsmB/NOP family class I SAM-dependent RNA methyltransferase, partial [Actinomycetota bacterium]|nr:RsmB/NOP family class I SAM-dependent RNA methyltransferase [Actinomycetota bacterium]
AAGLTVHTGLSTWAIRELERLLPPEQVGPAAEAMASRASLCLRTNTSAITPERFEQALRDAGHEPRPASLDPSCFLLEGGDPARLPGFDRGWFAVQDVASAFVVGALDPQPRHRVLDVCAAPGGKAAYAASRVGTAGLVVAADLHPGRAGMIVRTARRLGVPALVLAQDATAPALQASFDRILVDAPCSGLGSARRRPELLWRNKQEALSRLARTQVAIVSAVAPLLAPGGRLVYSVCTFPRAETDAVADAIVRHTSDLEPASIDGPDGPAPRIRLWPHRHGSDGMFVAAFARTG